MRLKFKKRSILKFVSRIIAAYAVVKSNNREHQGSKINTSACQAQGRCAFKKKSKFYFTEITIFLKKRFFS